MQVIVYSRESNGGPRSQIVEALQFASAVKRLERFTQQWPDVVRSLISKRWLLEEVPRLVSDPGPGVKHVVSFEET